VLVNVVGAFEFGDALTTTPESLRVMLEVNLGTALWLSQAAAPHMQQRGSGAIVMWLPVPPPNRRPEWRRTA
jgi:3-oxoacyl-[acyl-carrier protein] reductase